MSVQAGSHTIRECPSWSSSRKKCRPPLFGQFYCFITGVNAPSFCRKRGTFRILCPISDVNKHHSQRPQHSNSNSTLTGIVIDQLYIICSTAMVRFGGGKTTVQLSVTDLEKTAGTLAETSENAKQTRNLQQCNLEFVNGSQNRILPEVYINDPRDGMSTHFLGKNTPVPFLMAQAGYNIVSTSASEIRQIRPARIQLYGSLNGSKRQ